MPLDGHSFLVAQGWAGKGAGLREGAISKPLAIPQKRSLAGVGKDRDEAFPFWDHLFSAAAKSIQLKIHNSEEEEGSFDSEADPCPVLSRTSTGILSNRRPVTDISTGMSGAEDEFNKPRYSLLITARREAAKRNLYSRFFRGPILSPDVGLEQEELETDMKSRDVPAVSRPHLDTKNRNKEGRKKAKGHKNIKKGDKDRRKKKKTEDDTESYAKIVSGNAGAIDEEQKPRGCTNTLDNEVDRKRRKEKDKREAGLNSVKSETPLQGTSAIVDHRKKRRRKE